MAPNRDQAIKEIMDSIDGCSYQKSIVFRITSNQFQAVDNMDIDFITSRFPKADNIFFLITHPEIGITGRQFTSLMYRSNNNDGVSKVDKNVVDITIDPADQYEQLIELIQRVDSRQFD